MTLVTRCPACTTLFRVATQELKAREGLVRCGRCATVFDGYKTLATLPERPPAPPEDEPPAAVAPDVPVPGPDAPVAPPGPAVPVTTTAPLPMTPPVPHGFLFEQAEPAQSRPIQHPATTTPTRPPAARWKGRPEGVGLSPPVSADALFLQQAQAKRRRGSPLWTGGSIVLTVLLVLQALYVYRGELAARYPGLKPLMAGLCALAHCDIPLPQRPRLINIEASDLQSLDRARPGLIQLTATLRNHADHDLGYPALDLVLTNTRDHTLARRIFLPHEYLDSAIDPGAGFPAKAEVTVRLSLDTGDLGAAGFRLDLLPGP